MATQCGSLSKFFKISTLLHKYKQTHTRAFASSVQSSAHWRLDALTRLLHDNCSLKCLRKLHALLAVSGAIQETYVVTDVVDRYLSLGNPASAASVFAGAYRRHPNVYSLNLAIRCFSEHGFHRELLDLYRHLCGFGSDNFTLPPVIKACTAVSCLGLGKEVHCMALRTGYGVNVGVQTALLDMYAKAGQIDVSRRVFDSMVERDLISWNAMVSGYSLNGCFREAAKALQEMRLDGLRANASTFVGIVGVCGGAGVGDLGDSLHAFALKCGVVADESLTSALISMYAASGDLSSSRLVFDLQSVKDLVSCNSMISAYMQHSNREEAFEVFRLMHCAGIGPNLVTVVSVLPSCDFFGANHGESVHGMTIKFGLAEQVSVVSALVSMYSKLRKLDSAVLLFSHFTEKNHLLWNSMISGYLVNNEWNAALDTFREMQEVGVDPDAVTVINVISGCRHTKDLHVAKSIHAYTIRNKFESNQSVMNALLAMYADCGEIPMSYRLFQQMEIRTLISWNTTISGFAVVGDSETSLRLFSQMRREGMPYDLVTLISLISSLSVSEDVTAGESVHCLTVKNGCNSDVSLTNALITMYTRCGILEEGQKLFDSLYSRNTITYNALMSGYQKNNVSEKILPLFYHMIKNDEKPNLVTLLNLLHICEDQLQGKSIHSYAIRNFTRFETSLFTSTMCMYSRFNNIEYCIRIFNFVSDRNIVVWNAILSSCVQCKQAGIAFDFFRHMLFLNIEPDAVTMLALVSACSQLGNAEFAACVTAFIIHKGFNANISVLNALIDMHSRCGSISFARDLFDSSVEKDSVTWGAMINAYSMHGDGELAVDLFWMMIDSGVEPDDVTFVSVLSACSHSGLVEQGKELFKSLQTEHGIAPQMEHYACIVDLLGRTGHLNEAYDVVRSMPFRPSDSLLESLLGACKLHCNAKIGESVGKLLIESEHGKSKSYVMFSNIYASAGKWSAYEQLRSDMEEKGLRKDVGVSYAA